MARYIGRQILKQMAKMDKIISTARVAILGFTFKEDVPDVRNSKVFDLYKELKEFGLSPLVYDPIANKDDVKHEYGIELCNLEDLKNLDTIIVAVAHKEFKSMEAEDYRKLMNTHKLLLADIKHIFKRENYEKLGINYWSL
jgi:UDP-N-acetyl-D-galactosamine dehydrogenase